MTNVSAVSAAASGKTTTANKPSVPQRAEVYTVQAGDNLTKIGKKYGMTPEQFKTWTGLKSDSLRAGDKINLPQAKVPAGKGIMTLAGNYNMDFDKFCELNNIPKPYREYAAGKDEMFYVCKDYGKNKSNKSQGTTPAPKPEPEKTTPAPQNNNSKKIISAQKYTVPASGYISVGADETHNVRVISGKPPVPTIQEGKKEKIVAEVIRFQPLKSNTGELKGKVIMVNAGHGYKEGYYEKNADLAFDPGKPDAKDANGKQIEEWRKNRDFAEDLINQLRAKGATVIFTTGSAKLACQAKKDHKCDMFISLHCNAVANKNKNGIEVYYTEADKNGKGFQLAQKVAKKLGVPNDNIKSDITTRHGKIGVITDIGPKYAPSILLEMGYMTNSKDIANIDSWKVRQDQMEQVTQAIVETFNPPKPKKK